MKLQIGYIITIASALTAVVVCGKFFWLRRDNG